MLLQIQESLHVPFRLYVILTTWYRAFSTKYLSNPGRVYNCPYECCICIIFTLICYINCVCSVKNGRHLPWCTGTGFAAGNGPVLLLYSAHSGSPLSVRLSALKPCWILIILCSFCCKTVRTFNLDYFNIVINY